MSEDKGASLRKTYASSKAKANNEVTEYEEERLAVEDAMADFVQLPSKKKVPGLWQKKVKPEILEKMDQREIRRQEGIHEVIESEVFYLRDMAMAYRLFAVPLQTTHKNLVTYSEFREIFGNLSEIIVFHGSLGKTMRELRTASGEVDQIGATMLAVIDDLELIYANYCSNRANARDFLAQKRKDSVKLNKLIKEKELDPECRKLELDTFLSQPWQRMMHYPLLFQNILKKSLEDHPDQANLTQVIKRLNDIISRVNGYTESVQSSKIFEELNHCISSVSKHKAAELELKNPERKILMEGDLRSKWGRKLRGYFIDNCLIIVVVGDKMSLYCEPFLTTSIKLITTSDQVNITTNPKGEKAAAKVQRNQFQLVNTTTNSKFTFSTESASEKRRWIDTLQAELLRVSNSNWRDAYDQEFQLHENVHPKEEETRREGLDVDLSGQGRKPSAVSFVDSLRRGSEEVDVNTLATVHRLMSDPYNLLSYTKTMASCTSTMVHQLNAKALMATDNERRDNLWLTAKVIADSTVELIRNAKLLAQKHTDEEKKQALSSYLDSFKGLHATLNLNVDDLEDVVGGGKLEAPKDEAEDAPETDPAELLHKLSKLEDNSHCADCGQDNPLWISMATNALLCRECAEAHKLVFQSRFPEGQAVKNIETDDFTLAEVTKVSKSTNTKLNQVLTEVAPKPEVRTHSGSQLEERVKLTTLKYVDRAFVGVSSVEEGIPSLSVSDFSESSSVRTSQASVYTPPSSPAPTRRAVPSAVLGQITISKISFLLNDMSIVPYALLKLGEQSHKTQPLSKGKEGIWGGLELSLDLERYSEVLTVRIFEKNQLAKDEVVATGELQLDFLEVVGPNQVPTTHNLRLVNSERAEVGICLLETVFVK